MALSFPEDQETNVFNLGEVVGVLTHWFLYDVRWTLYGERWQRL